MGLWQGSWYSNPKNALSSVPLAMGVVIPVQKIREILDLPLLKRLRDLTR